MGHTLLKATIGAFCALLCLTSGLSSAKHVGITRHYKFDVSLIHDSFLAHYHSLNELLHMEYQCFTDQDAERHATMSNQEHCDGQRTVPGASDHRKGRRSACNQGG